MTDIICGVDVSSRHLDARVGPDGAHLRVARTPEGIAELAALCRAHGVGLVVMEATGGYERLPVALLWEAGVPCALANPRSVRRFAEAMGVLEKTDRIDAGLIARYAAVKGLVPQAPAGDRQRRLSALTLRLRQVTAARVAQANQRRLAEGEDDVAASFARVIACLDAEIEMLAGRIEALIGTDPLWAEMAEAFRGIKGVADRSVANLLAFVPEIGTLSNKAVAKLIGLAPIANDSGKREGKRPVRGGRAPVRALLVLVAGVVARFEPDFVDMRERRAKAGKPPMVVRVALARKLLVRLNAKARDVRRAFAAKAAGATPPPAAAPA